MNKNNSKAGGGFINSLWIFIVQVVGYPIAFCILLVSSRAVARQRIIDSGLNADAIFKALINKGWLEAVTPTEARLKEDKFRDLVKDPPIFEKDLKELFSKDFDKIRTIVYSPRWSYGVFVADLTGDKGRLTAIEWGESVLVAFILAMLIRTYLFQPFKIPSGSMIPTLQVGDRLFVNKLAYGPSLLPVELQLIGIRGEPVNGVLLADPKDHSWWGKALHSRIPGFTKPQRGDVIVFRYPVTRDKDFIKRLIAFGGETVEIRDGKIYINDRPVTEGPLTNVHYLNRGDYGAEGQKINVPKGYYFVLGDNTGSSADSRYWGFVPEHFLIGRADVIFWPLNRIRWIK